ncbi:Bug family tripartite tricarboxylate transporter substrate binding protein [Phyllobacterium ifriqiyense]|uniref:Bug family tripartite tricarboxylate transporter substrate binding protein n=1 Tax=Phyllobacterium ifriqiyense TaxID=314238 RepID=UPI003398C001
MKLRTLAFALAFGMASSAQADAVKNIEIIAPAGPGGGYDQLARSTQQSLQDLELAGDIQVVNRPGAGGTIGLAEFVSKKYPDTGLIVTGIGMVGSILTNNAPVTMDQTKPIARMTGEYLTLVVPADSPLKNMDDLVKAFKADPGSVSLGGFAAGGVDHLLYGMIVKAIGGDLSKMNYVAIGAGGEMLGQVMGGHISVGAGGYSEFAGQISAGTVRALGISSATRLEGIDVPTMKEQGVDVELVNWRGFLGQANLSEEQTKDLDAAFSKMAQSPEWQATLKKHGWVDLYQPSTEFAAYIKEQQATVLATFRELKLVE